MSKKLVDHNYTVTEYATTEKGTIDWLPIDGAPELFTGWILMWHEETKLVYMPHIKDEFEWKYFCNPDNGFTHLAYINQPERCKNER